MVKILKLFIPILSLTFVIAISSCNNQKCEVKNSTIIRNDSIISIIEMDYVASYINEPKVQNVDFNCYRLTKLHALNVQDEMYQIEQRDEGIFFTTKYIYKNRDSISIFRNDRIPLTPQQWSDFNNAMNDVCFWAMPCAPMIEKEELEGNTWLLEAFSVSKNESTKRNYHIVGRKQSEDDAVFFELCEKLMVFDKE